MVDLVLVLVFCTIGRLNHNESIFGGLPKTAWPFVVGLALGWLAAVIVTDRLRDGGGNPKPFESTALWPTGVVVWVCTLVGGMLLRAVSGQGVAVSFVVVAAIVLALFLLGWRGAARALGVNLEPQR
ncbi:DUF3054 domain-containing protein [Nocardia callitridis]|uniref:DUF3054 domain-containing protein n=1 Tax=Nocardia callitridis TaxID=648753 RepID=A0ABP9JXD3_9NOCA